MTTPVETAAAVKDRIGQLGGGFMVSPQARAAGKGLGLRGWQYYFIGRCGVLGRVDPAVVSAAVYFFPDQTVTEAWTAASAVLSPEDGAQHYAGTCQDWGRHHLAGAPDLDRLAGLLEQVVAAAPVAGLPLFAGWRALPLPDDPPARVALLCQVLREHRGGCHGIAVMASGLTPLEAVVAGSYGAGNAQFFGWPEPYPDPAPLVSRRAAAESLTDRLAAPAWAALDDAQSEECRRLLDAAGEAALAAAAAAPKAQG